MSNTKFVYHELLNVSGNLARILATVKDFPPFYDDRASRKFAKDIDRAKRLLDNARETLAALSLVSDTTGQITDLDINEYLRNGGGLIDAQTGDAFLYCAAEPDERPSETPYFVYDEPNAEQSAPTAGFISDVLNIPDRSAKKHTTRGVARVITTA